MLRRKLLQHARTFHTHPVETPKRPARGQNLSERFRRLEKMVLAKHNLNQTITQSPQVSQLPTLSLPTTSRQSTQTTFRGLVIPEIPKAPEPDGGCTSGYDCLFLTRLLQSVACLVAPFACTIYTRSHWTLTRLRSSLSVPLSRPWAYPWNNGLRISALT